MKMRCFGNATFTRILTLGLLLSGIFLIISGCVHISRQGSSAAKPEVRAVWVSVLGTGLKSPEEIKLSEVIGRLEGSLAPVKCVTDPAVCNRSEFCVTRDIWSELKAAMDGVLQSTTLQDLVERQKGKGQPMYYI